MASIEILACDSCGLEIKNEGLKVFWLDFPSGELMISRQTRITMRNFYDNTLLRGYLSKRYCSHCRNPVYTYHLDNCGEGYDIERARDLLQLIIKGYKVNVAGLSDYLYGGDGSLSSFIKPKQGFDNPKETVNCIISDRKMNDIESCPNCGAEIDFLTDGSPCPRCSYHLRRIRAKFLD